MNATALYDRLEQEFHLGDCCDDWSQMGIGVHLTEQYRQRYMGLMTDCTERVSYVYTAVFPSQKVISNILASGRRKALLFVHHPMQWDITKTPVFSDISDHSLQLLQERTISIYNLHVPLDAYGPYSTSYTLAEALGIRVTSSFYEYYGVHAGVIGATEIETTAQLQQRFAEVVGHSVKLYPYGEASIKDGKVALVAGGGNRAEIYPLLREQGINTYVTGIANKRNSYGPSVAAHCAAEECGVNILAGTHYSTEKFACIKLVDYFARLGLEGEFVEDIPCMEDI